MKILYSDYSVDGFKIFLKIKQAVGVIILAREYDDESNYSTKHII